MGGGDRTVAQPPVLARYPRTCRRRRRRRCRCRCSRCIFFAGARVREDMHAPGQMLLESVMVQPKFLSWSYGSGRPSCLLETYTFSLFSLLSSPKQLL
ncbi:hypothetical protein LX32DRAFT_642841 [Colletotrichum zoysiae]|uniref:Uncharacterized protein n=1 Tax=Colletotrichum zoysiae TaxID=1216348 RepID=A0AAD9HBK1_9PEZI|nr:hypothetical protein LX32DRAFT_642841 [Colletotrichum zoysiae]